MLYKMTAVAMLRPPPRFNLDPGWCMPGRPLQFDRKRAVRTALGAFWNDGYSHVSVNGLCERLGITRSSFYNAFGSLEELFEEAVALYASYAPQHKARLWLEAVDPEAPEAAASAVAAIRAMFEAACRHRGSDVKRRGCMIVNSMNHLDRMPPALRRRMLAHQADNLELYATLLRRAVDRGELPADSDIEALALSLQTLMAGLNTLSRTEADGERLWRSATRTLDGLGIRSPQAAQGT